MLGAMIGVETFLAVFLPEHRAPIERRWAVTLACLGMFAIGFWDDLTPLGAKRKLAAQILVSLLVWVAGVGIERFQVPFTERIIALNGWGAMATVVWLVGIANLLNLIDGVDGLAAGIALMLMVLLGYMGYRNDTFVLLTAGMAGALLSFLRFNFPPARIYLGDGGAYFLGCQIGLFASVGSHKGSIFASLIAPLLVLGVPIVDAVLALLRRGLRGLPLFRPDRRHIHHRLLGMGMSRRKVVLWLYGLTLLFLGLGFAACWSRGDLVPVLGGVAVVSVLLCAGRLGFSREWFAMGRTLGNSLAMRREVEYASCLARWLKLEAGRGASGATLYKNLVWAAQRLGFTRVTVEIAGEERKPIWEETVDCDCVRSVRHHLGFPAGILELQGPACLAGTRGIRHQNSNRPACALACPWKTNVSRFEVISELLAEGWARAASVSKPAGTGLEVAFPATRGTETQPVRAGFETFNSLPTTTWPPRPRQHQ